MAGVRVRRPAKAMHLSKCAQENADPGKPGSAPTSRFSISRLRRWHDSMQGKFPAVGFRFIAEKACRADSAVRHLTFSQNTIIAHGSGDSLSMT